MQWPAFIALLFACSGLVPADARGEEAPVAIGVSTADSPEWDCTAADRAFVYWRSTIGTNCGFPAIGNGRILIGTNNGRPRDARTTADCGVMMCFDLSDGRFLWQATHPRLPSWHADLPKMAIACTPAIVGDRAFYTSNRGELVCVDLLGFSDGENDGPFVGEQRDEHAADIVWVLDDMLYIGLSSTFERRGDPAGKLLAIRLSESAGSLSSKVVWEFRAPRFGGTHATPAVREGIVYTQGVTGTIFAIDAATGHELWASDLNGDGEAAMYAAPVVHDGMLLVADPEYLYAFSLGPRPQCVGRYYFDSRLMSTPLVREGRLYFAVSENLYCLRPPAEILKAPADGR